MADPGRALGLAGDLDDYARRPPGRWSEPWSPLSVKLATALGALLAGFLLASAAAGGQEAARAADARKADLVALVRERQERAEALGVQLEELRARVAQAEDRAADGLPALQTQLRQVEANAGLTPLRGPGLRVTLEDGSGSCPTGSPEDCRIQDVDLQLAVNALFALGAEAVAVNGERVIGTTAIRSAGGAVLVNYRVLGSPYVIDALGGPSALGRFADSSVAADFSAWRETYGLGFSIAPADDLELPGYRGSVRLRAAAPPAPDDRPDRPGEPG